MANRPFKWLLQHSVWLKIKTKKTKKLPSATSPNLWLLSEQPETKLTASVLKDQDTQTVKKKPTTPPPLFFFFLNEITQNNSQIFRNRFFRVGNGQTVKVQWQLENRSNFYFVTFSVTVCPVLSRNKFAPKM